MWWQMIISYLHKFVFIKTRKTAGSSMEIALATHAGADDIVTPLGFNEELERYAYSPQALPRNFFQDRKAEAAFIDAIREGNKPQLKQIYRLQRQRGKSSVTARHGSATAALKITGPEFWAGAYKFAVERHPYEKAVSLAWFERHGRRFDDVLEEVLRRDRYRNFDIYAAEGKPLVDFVVRYEHLDEDLRKVEWALGGLPIRARLPHVNSHQRQDRRPAADILSGAQKRAVQETCREEFELLSYPT